MVFARQTSGPLTSLVKKLDEATVKNRDQKLGSFVVFLGDDAGTAEKLIALAAKEKIEQTILALGEAAGPVEEALRTALAAAGEPAIATTLAPMVRDLLAQCDRLADS